MAVKTSVLHNTPYVTRYVSMGQCFNFLPLPNTLQNRSHSQLFSTFSVDTVFY